MKHSIARRSFLLGTAAVAVVGFDPISKSWASGGGGISLPSLDGQILTDAATLTAAADDFGHIVHRTPTAVLVPGSIHDVKKLVKFANKHGIKVAAARGIGESHGTQGQAQVEAGVVIDMSALDTIHEICGDSALVDGGVRWIDLLGETVPLGKSPPVLNDFIELSVGGTLSVGGIGGQAFRHGFQVDNVLELTVVTGEGKLVECSPSHRSDLFDAVRAGLGQFGIIVRARVKLIDVPPMVRTYTAVYGDITTFTNDQEMLIEDGRFDYVEGAAAPDGAGGWVFALEAAKYFSPASPPDDAAQLAGLSFIPGTNAATDATYFDFANRLAPAIAFLKQIGAWYLPHPWLNVFVPGPAAPSFIQGVLDETTEAETGQGPVLLYPFKRSKLDAPFTRVPNSPHPFILSLLRNAIPPIPAVVDGLVALNRSIFDDLVAIGGKRYPIDSVPMTNADWQQHFGAKWALFAAAKQAFDPEHVLAPGQAIF